MARRPAMMRVVIDVPVNVDVEAGEAATLRTIAVHMTEAVEALACRSRMVKDRVSAAVVSSRRPPRVIAIHYRGRPLGFPTPSFEKAKP